MNGLSVVIEQRDGIIDFSNFEELKGQLSTYLDEYREASFTEETKGQAKEAVADLRKLKKGINDRKIEIKKRFIQPYEEFEAKTKELLVLIEEPITLIDSQIKVFESKRIEERKQLIQEAYDSAVGDLAAYAPLSRIYSAKWENISTSRKKIEEELEQAFLGIRMDIESLRLMRVEPNVVEFALDKYKRGETAIEAMRKANEFAELMEKMKKIEAEEAERKRAVEQAAVPEQIQEPEPNQEMEEGFTWGSAWDPTPMPWQGAETGFGLPFVTPSTKKATYQIVASDNDITDLETYMDSVGISFERIG